MQDSDLDHLLDLVERLGGLLRSELRGCVPAQRLQPVHVQILGYLSRCNRFSDTPQAIAAYLGATKGTVSQSIRQVQERGLVTKVADTTDRRKVHVRLTPAGRRALRTCRLNRIPATAGARLHERAVRGAVETLETLLGALQRAHGHRLFGQCRGCRHLQDTGAGYRCGLTGEALAPDDTRRICYEFEPPAAPPAPS